MADGCVEGNPNKVLRRIDERVLGRMECDRRSILAQAVYMAERLHAATPEYDLTRHATGMLEFIIRELTHTQLCPTLYHVNSALHFLASARSLPGTKEPCERIMAMLPSLYERMSSETRATRADTHIHQLLLRQLESDIRPSLQAQTEEHAMTTDNSTDIAATEQFLQASWQELTYFGRIYSTLPPPRALSAFIDRKQESMQEHGFCMERGLAGMGLAIMARDKKNADTAHMTTTNRNATQA